MLMHHIWLRPPGHTYITMHGSIDTDPMVETKEPIKLSFGGRGTYQPYCKIYSKNLSSGSINQKYRQYNIRTKLRPDVEPTIESRENGVVSQEQTIGT